MTVYDNICFLLGIYPNILICHVLIHVCTCLYVYTYMCDLRICRYTVNSKNICLKWSHMFFIVFKNELKGTEKLPR